MEELISRVKSDQKARVKLEENVPFNILNTGQSTTGLNGRFVYSHVLMEMLLRINYGQSDKNELIDLCKKQYDGNQAQLEILNEFERSYSRDDAVRWYTRESFLYRMLNRALRAQDIHILFLFRAFSSDIHQQLKHNQCSNRIQAYRVQMISAEELKSLSKSVGQFISVNSFFSTSLNRQEALEFWKHSVAKLNDLEQVLFEIDADPSVATTKPFADISSLSAFETESEVLFMLGSIFRVTAVDKDQHGILVVRMNLCSNNDHDLKLIMEYMQKQYGSEGANLRSFAKLLTNMGERDLAEKYYLRLLNQLDPDDSACIGLYNELSILAAGKHDFDASIEWTKKLVAAEENYRKKGKLRFSRSLFEKINFLLMNAP